MATKKPAKKAAKKAEAAPAKKELLPSVEETKAVALFRRKTQKAMAKIESLDEFKASDAMVKYVFDIGRSMFDTDLDRLAEPWLIKTGGRLTGVYAYLGNRAARARAERDVYLQKSEEVEAELMVEYLKDGEYKVTGARAQIKVECTELREFVTLKELEKNNFENLLNATDKMVSFIQSAIRVKEAERYKTKMSGN